MIGSEQHRPIGINLSTYPDVKSKERCAAAVIKNRQPNGEGLVEFQSKGLKGRQNCSQRQIGRDPKQRSKRRRHGSGLFVAVSTTFSFVVL